MAWAPVSGMCTLGKYGKTSSDLNKLLETMGRDRINSSIPAQIPVHQPLSQRLRLMSKPTTTVMIRKPGGKINCLRIAYTCKT